MANKEQIIINGINIFDTLDEWADLISQNWCSAEYLTAEIIKNHILGINKQLARKTQECEELKRKVELMMDCPDCKVDEYKKALEGIEKVINNILNSCLGRNTVSCRPAHNVCGDLIKILDIINKAKGEE